PINPDKLVDWRISYDGGVSLAGTDGATFSSVVAAFLAGFDDVVFIAFRRTAGADGLDFYVEFLDAEFDPIPVPAALPLLLSGLAGLGFASRRRKNA
ncbi:MAG: VPLPA-CTERM sorting domain-containing protein, partial [Marinicaulis sp.]|nr:VPLPA-CTERM sorting domain-containing protein [Marinicaulis sp.]